VLGGLWGTYMLVPAVDSSDRPAKVAALPEEEGGSRNPKQLAVFRPH
jgi:hypothetical protein